MLGRAAGIDLSLVPYRGGAPSITDLLGGHIPATVNPLAEVLPSAANGELRILLTMGTTRSRFAPEVPSAQEFGCRDSGFQDWSGVFAPVGTPPALIGRADTLINQVIRSDRGTEALAKFGAEADPHTPEEFAAIIRADFDRYGAIVRDRLRGGGLNRLCLVQRASDGNRISTCPSATRVGKVQRGRSTGLLSASPVVTSNCPPWRGHSTTVPSSHPSDSSA
jgi:hypothetical protein